MRRLLPILLSIAWLSTGESTAAPATSPPAREDIAAIRSYLDNDKAYSRPARAEALARIEQLRERPLTPAQLDLELAAIAALADNGHSMLLPAQWTTRYPRIPVRLGLFADGLFVLAAEAEHDALRGLEVIAINGRPWRELHGAYSRYQGGLQSFRDQFVTYFLETPALLEAAGFGKDNQNLELTLRDGGGSRTVMLKAQLAPLEGEAALLGSPPLLEGLPLVPAGRMPLYLQQPDQNFRLAFRPEIDGAYLRLNATRGEGLGEFLQSASADLDRRKPRNIVLDLRFNMGGDLTAARTFMEALPSLARGGRIYAITSGRTFSAAISSLGYLKQAAGNRLTIVGEPVGDRLEFWAEGDVVEVPGLGATLLYATERHNYVDGCPEPDCHRHVREHPIRVSSLDPDIRRPLRFVDFIQGRDPSYEAVVADVRRRQHH